MKTMFTPDLPPAGIDILLLALILIAAIYDLRFRRIPNWLTDTGVACGLAANLFLYPGWPGTRLSLGGMAAGQIHQNDVERQFHSQ